MEKRGMFSIQAKLLVAGLAIIAALGVLWLVTMLYFVGLNQKANQAKVLAEDVLVQTLEARKSEKDFMLRELTNGEFYQSGKSSYLDKHAQAIAAVREGMSSLDALGQVGHEELASLSAALNTYESSFADLVAAYRDIGYEDWGIQGKWRAAVHSVEASLEGTGQLALLAEMLQLRRDEKDYLLRGDEKYVTAVREDLARLREDSQRLFGASESRGVTAALAEYETAFNSYLQGERRIGMTEEQGLQGAMRDAVHQVDPLIQEVMAAASARSDRAYSNLVLAVLVIMAVGVLLGVLVFFAIARSISRPINHVVGIMEKMAGGDLTSTISERMARRRDEVGLLLASLKNMFERLSQIIREVRTGADNVASGSQQMSSTSEEMSQGATEQAASAEEVSSSMEEMSSNIKQNAENALQTEKIALKAAEDAQDSGSAVNEAVTAMNEIAAKISIIEEIARQTNLLALNAAIEAARAGEQGKGFAVVASEVRKLAERSQAAAAEISELSGNTVSIAQRAGEMLNRLVPDIKKTAELVQEISAASNEQNSGADQINRAIAQLDEVIQQNASASEELASTSEELSSQAEQLQASMEFFKIDGHERRMLTYVSGHGGGRPAAAGHAASGPRAGTGTAGHPVGAEAGRRPAPGGGNGSERGARTGVTLLTEKEERKEDSDAEFESF